MNIEERNAIVEQYTPLVLGLARKYANKGNQSPRKPALEELRQILFTDLLSLVPKCDFERRSASVTSFLQTALERNLWNYFRDNNLIKYHRDDYWAMSRGEQVFPSFVPLRVAVDFDGRPIEETLGEYDPAMDDAEDRVLARELLSVLLPAERRVIDLCFFTGLSQARVAEATGYSQMQVSRLIRAALLRMRRYADTGTRGEESSTALAAETERVGTRKSFRKGRAA